MWGLVCWMQVSKAGTSNSIRQILWVWLLVPALGNCFLIQVLTFTHTEMVQAVAILPSGQERHSHYFDLIMSAMASQITGVSVVNSIVYSGPDQRKHQNSHSLAFVRGIHRWPVNTPHKGVSNVENVSIWWRHHDCTRSDLRYVYRRTSVQAYKQGNNVGKDLPIHVINTMSADVLATQGARASAAMVLTYFSRNDSGRARQGFIKWLCLLFSFQSRDCVEILEGRLNDVFVLKSWVRMIKADRIILFLLLCITFVGVL